MRPREIGSTTLASDRAGPSDVPGYRDHHSASVIWATRVLRDQGMPPEELAVVVTAGDPEVVRRYVDLHLERMDERLADARRRALVAERILGQNGRWRRP